MTTKQAAVLQIERFTQAGFVPVPTPVMEAELVNIFADLCVGEVHVAKAGDWLIRNVEYYPKPKDIADAVRALQDESIRQAAEPRDWRPKNGVCDVCGDTTWMQSWELHTYHGTVSSKTVERITQDQYRELSKKVDGRIGTGQVAIETAKRCTACEAGRRVRQAEKAPPEIQPAPKTKKNRGAAQIGLNVVPIRDMGGDSY